jgi:hypothetical protein
MKKKTLSQEDLAVLRVAEIGKIKIEDAMLQSGLSKAQFWDCVDTLVRQKYLWGDVLMGFYRTKKLLPVQESEKEDKDMAATGVGFVQQHEAEAKDGTLYQSIDDYLTRTYGKVRPSVSVGLRWLTGLSGYDSHLDHPEYRIKDGRKTIVARPYGLNLDQVERLVELAKAKNLRLLITSPSNYNLDTVLVILTEPVKPKREE